MKDLTIRKELVIKELELTIIECEKAVSKLRWYDEILPKAEASVENLRTGDDLYWTVSVFDEMVEDFEKKKNEYTKLIGKIQAYRRVLEILSVDCK